MKVLYQSASLQELAGRTEEAGASRDLLLLVLALPQTQGLQLWSEILRDPSFHGLPITILLAHGDEAAQVFNLKNGNTKDPERRGLADARRLLGRVEPECDAKRAIEAGELVIDPATRCVSRSGKAVRLTSLEFRLLYYLASRANHSFTREQLLCALWDSGDELNARIVDVYVRRLRLKIETQPAHPMHLKTRRGIGYMFDAGGTEAV